eukprot:5879010-Pyramimonas_sp.AAC.1
MEVQRGLRGYPLIQWGRTREARGCSRACQGACCAPRLSEPDCRSRPGASGPPDHEVHSAPISGQGGAGASVLHRLEAHVVALRVLASDHT